MAVIVKDLGIASAYGYAKSKGYTGTEEEFAELMASYADVAQQAEAAAQDAEDAKDEAVTAKTDAQTAKTAAQAAQSASETASGAASTKASEAAQSAQAASGSATAAQTSATAAAGSAQTAQAAAQTATTKASEASSSASAASTAKTGAETARTGAQTAQTAAETAQANAEAAAASVSASAAQIEQNTEDITGLKNDLSEFPNGNYPQMGAGYANQLVSGLKKADQTPYNFRAVPYDATLEEVEKIVGGTIPWNQQIQSSDKSGSNSGTDTRALNLRVQEGSNNIIIASQILSVGAFSAIINASFTGSNAVIKHSSAVRDIPFAYGLSIVTSHKYLVSLYFSGVDLSTEGGMSYDNFMFTDLTLDFGTSIADYVYTLETATAGAGVAWLKKHFPKQFDSGYQAYDAGTLKSIEGLSGKKTVGFNQWDEEWELGSISVNTGDNVGASSNIRAKNFCPMLPNTAYCFKNPSGGGTSAVCFYDSDKNYLGYASVGSSAYLVFTSLEKTAYFRLGMASVYGTTYNHDICINLSDPTKNGEYKPYEAHSYALDSDAVLRGIPKLDSNNQLYYDGDEYLPDGTVNRRYGIVDLGTLNWEAISGYAGFFKAETTEIINTPNGILANALCPKYVTVKGNELSTKDKAIAVGMNNAYQIQISDSAHSASSASDFKTAMSGVMLLYEKKLPTTETADPYTTPQIISPDGTEEYVYEDGAFELPVGHSSEYPVNVSGQLDDILDTPSANGTYTLKATVTDGAVSYSWVADA